MYRVQHKYIIVVQKTCNFFLLLVLDLKLCTTTRTDTSLIDNNDT